MKKKHHPLRFFLICFFFIGCNSSETAPNKRENNFSLQADLSEQTILHNGVEREYLIYIPESYNEDTKSPVLLSFHGFGGDASSHLEYESDFRDIADEEGLILLYPQGSLLSGFSHWNAAPLADDNKSDADDIGFIETLLDDLQDNLSIDSNQIYATGFSNGAMFSYALACFTEGLIAGVAAVSGVQLNIEDCMPSKAMNVLIAHGTSDDVLPYYGSLDLYSVDEIVSFWTSVNQTSAVAEESSHNLGDETVWLYTYSEGTNGAEVLHYKVENGKHEWFNHNLAGQSFPSLVWDFLSPQTLSGRKD